MCIIIPAFDLVVETDAPSLEVMAKLEKLANEHKVHIEIRI